MAHEHRERVVTVVTRAQAIRDTCHSVAVNGVSCGEDTLCHDSQFEADEAGRLQLDRPV